MNRLRRQEGMTLPEMLVAMVIAMIVSLATFALIEVVMRRSGEIATRVDTTQRSRTAMDFMTRELRSQVCVQATKPAMTDDRLIYSATPTTITFFADFADESTANTPGPPELRSLSLENGKLIERRYTGVQDAGTTNHPTYTYANYPALPTQTRVLADDISTVDTTAVGTPLVFRYFKFSDPTPTVPAAPTVEMDSRSTLFNADAALIAKIDIAFRANRARGKSADRGSIVLKDSVFVRNADPNATTPKPVCV